MADRIDRDRAKDSSIKTDDLDLGSIDDISLDFPGDGDEGVEMGKGRKPTNPKKEFAIEFAKGLGGGVKSATVSELKKVLPEGAAIVNELGATFDDIKSLKDDLSRQLGPMTATIENATRKLLPKAEKYLPKKLYEKTKKKLDERAAMRQGYTSPSKEQIEQEQISAEIASLFSAQAETNMAELRERKTDELVNRAMGSVRHRQQIQQLTHLYDSVRATELFHRTQHMAYMKKSLELKYKHVFIARDTFNLLQQSMKTFEGYYKGILTNTALPDMVKTKIGDYHRKNRTEKYGNMMSEALSNIRGKIFDKIKGSVSNVMSRAGFMTDMLGMGADMADTMGGKGLVPNLLGKVAGFVGASPIAKKMLGKLAPFTGALNTSLGGMKANAAVGLANLREKWQISDNLFKMFAADFIPDTFSQSTVASNDLLSKGKEAATFDVITRQSITEIIPGYLGKILHEVTKIQTGDANVEEQTFNVYERRFTGVSTLKKDLYDRAFGDEKARRTRLNKTLAIMQAGVARNRPDKDANEVFKGYEKDINRFFLNHAQYGVVFKPDKLREYLATANNNDTYINKVCHGFENNPAFVIEALCSALFDEDGEIDKQARDDIQIAITENYRKFDQYKMVLADANETYGLKQHLVSKMDGQAEKRLRRLIDEGDVAKSRMSSAKTDEQKTKYRQQIEEAKRAREQLESDSGLFTSSQDDIKLNFGEIVNRRNDLDFDSVDANDEDWDRRSTYERYRKFDHGADLMHQHGMKYGGKFANALGAHARIKMREYNDVFNIDDSLKNSGKPEEKKSYKTKDVLKAIVPASIQEKIMSAVKTVRNMTGEKVDRLTPEAKKQFSEAKAKVASLKKQFEGTETSKKVLEQLTHLESIYDSAVKQGDDGIKWLKDEGAFDDPTGFLKKMYGSGTTAVKGWTESLPSVTDIEGWKDLLQQKKDDTVRFAQEKAEALKASGVGAKLSGIKGQIKGKLTEALSGLKDKAKEGLRDAGVEIPGAAPTGGGTVPPPPPITPVTDNVVEPEGVGSSVVVDRLDQLIGITSEWKKESTDNQGTIFDAITQIDEDLKKIPSFGGKGGADIGEALEALDPNYRRFKNRRRFLNKAANAVGAGIKGVGKMYTKVYGAALKGAGQAVKGLGYAAGNAIKSTYKAAAGIGKWLTTKEDYVDIYVKGKEGGMPIVSARKQKDPDEGIFYKSSGKRVLHSRDIDEPCVDKRGQLVITEEDLKAGLVMNNSTPIGKIGAGVLAIAKGYFSVYGKALTAIGGVAKTVAKGLFGSGVERWQDVYRKDEVGKGPLLTARKQKEEGVYFFESGKKVEKTSDIHEPICDRDKKILISKEDIEHGLVNVDNKPLGSGGGGGIVGALARGVAAAMPGLGKFVGKAGSTLMDIYGKGYKGLMDVGFGALKGAGKFLGRALGLDMSGIGGAGDKETKDAIVGSHTMLKLIQADVALMAAQYKEEKNPLDKDGDGDIDGSYADQMQNKKDSGGTRVDAKDVHKDVNWLKEEKEEGGGGKGGKEDGGSIFDMLGKFLPKKWRAKLGAFKSAFGKKAMAFAKGAGSWMLKGGRALMTGAAGLFSKSLPFLAKAGGALKGAGGAALTGAKALGAKALPALGTAGKAALGAGKFLGGKAALLGAKALPMMGSAIGSAGSAIGGLASAAGPALMAAAPWLAGAAAVAGAGYLGYKALGIGGLIKGIKGNDNPLTEKEIEKGRTKLQRKIDKGMPGYDRILQEYEKAVSAQNWRRARELSGQEADGIIKSMWKESWIGKGISGIGNFFFGKKDEEMSKEEIEKTRAKFNSIIKKGGSAGKNAEKLLSKFEDYVSEQDWKNARKIAGAEKRGLFGKLFQDSKGNIKWGTVIGGLVGGIPGLVIGSLFNKADVNKPMTEEEVKKARERLQKLADGGNKAASKILDQFDEAVTEQNWKKARKLVGEEVQSNLTKLGGAVKTTAKWALRIGTLGLSTLFESDQDKPMSDDEIKKFTDKMNFLIEKHHDKLAKKKLEKFEEAVAAQKWDKARQIAKMPHKSLLVRANKAMWNWTIGSDEEPMTEQEMTKFRESMQRKIQMGNKGAQRKLDAFEDAVGAQRWRRARSIAQSPNDGWLTKGVKALGSRAANNFRFWFGGDGKPMTESEIEQARREMGWAISENKKGAQKRLDLFNDYVADEKWEKARKLAKMPYENVVKRVSKAIGNFLFGNDKEALTPEEIDKFQKECEQRITDGAKGNWSRILEQFNAAVEAQNWAKARKLSGLKAEGAIKKVAKALNPLNWFKDDYEDCQKKKEELEEKAIEDETGLVNKGIEQFDTLVRRQKYSEALDLAKDLLKMKPADLAKKHGLKSDEYDSIIKEGQELQERVDHAIKKEKPGFFPSLKARRLQSIKADLMINQAKWGADYFEEIRDKISNITGEDEYADVDKVDDSVIKKGQELLEDINESKSKYNWFTSPIIRAKLAGLESEVKSEMADWNEGSFQNWEEKLRDIDKSYKSREEKARDAKKAADIEKNAQDKAGTDESKADSKKIEEITALKGAKQIAIDYYGEDEIKKKPWLGQVEDVGNPEAELREELRYRGKMGLAKKTAEDSYRWRGLGENGTDKTADNAFNFRKDKKGKLKQHQIIGNKIEGWQWDENNADSVIKWKDGIAQSIKIKDLTDEELIEIANQSRNTGDRRATDLDYDNELQNLARSELDKRGVKYEGKDDEELKWMGKSDADNNPKKTTNHATAEMKSVLGVGISMKAHQLLGNKLEGWEWDLQNSDQIIRWKNFNKTAYTWKDLSDSDLLELAHQKSEKKYGGFIDSAKNEIQNRAIGELKSRGVPEEWWNTKTEENEETKQSETNDNKPKDTIRAGGGFFDNIKGHLKHLKNVAEDKLDSVGLKGLGVGGTLRELKNRVTGNYTIDPEMERLMRLPEEDAIKEIGSREAYIKMRDEYDRLRTSGYMDFKNRMLGNRFDARGEYVDGEFTVKGHSSTKTVNGKTEYSHEESVDDKFKEGFAPLIFDRNTREQVGAVDKYKFGLSNMHNDVVLEDNDTENQLELYRSGRVSTIDPDTGKLVKKRVSFGQRYDELDDLMDRNRKRGWLERAGMKAKGFFKDLGVRGIGGKFDKSGVPAELQSLYDQAYEIATTNPKHAEKLVESLFVKWSAENKEWLEKNYPDSLDDFHDCAIMIAKDPNQIKDVYVHLKGIIEKSVDKLKSVAKSGVDKLMDSNIGANFQGVREVIRNGKRSEDIGIKTGFWRKLTNSEEATAEMEKIMEMSPEEGIKYCGSEEAWRACVRNYRHMRLNKRLGWWDRITGKDLNVDRYASGRDRVTIDAVTGTDGSYGTHNISSDFGEDVETRVTNFNGKSSIDQNMSFPLVRTNRHLTTSYGDMTSGTTWEDTDVGERIRSNDVDNAADKFFGVGATFDTYANEGMSTRERMDAFDTLIDANRKKKWYEKGLDWVGAKLTGNKLAERPEWLHDSKRNRDDHVALMAEAIQVAKSGDPKQIEAFRSKVTEFLSKNIQNGTVSDKNIKPYIEQINKSVNAIIDNPDDPGKIPYRDDYEDAKEMLRTSGYVTDTSAFKSNAEQVYMKDNRVGPGSYAEYLLQNPIKAPSMDMIVPGRNTVETATADLIKMQKKPTTTGIKPESTDNSASMLSGAIQSQSQQNAEMVAQMKQMAETNQKLTELLSSVFTKEGMKIQGMDTLTEVCAIQPPVPDNGSPTVHIIQQPAEPQSVGLDLRKRQA